MPLLLFKMGALAIKAGFGHGLCHFLGLGGVIVHIQLAGDHAIVLSGYGNAICPKAGVFNNSSPSSGFGMLNLL